MASYSDNLTSKPSVILSDQENKVVNLFRLVAAFLVVSIHVHANTPLANQYNSVAILFCVPYFFSTALTFLAGNLKKKVAPALALRKIWSRTGIPFIAWSTIYVSFLVIKQLITGSGISFTIFSILRAYLYGESAEHLYFLPELAVMQVIVLGIFMIYAHRQSRLGWFLLFLSATYLGWGYAHAYYGLTPILALITYVSCAFLLTSDALLIAYRKVYLLVGASLVLIAVASHYFIIDVYNLPIGGIGLLIIALYAYSFTLPAWLSSVTHACYGIYLSHVLFLEGFEFVIDKSHISLYYTLPVKLSVTLFIFLLSLVFTLAVQRIPFLRIILLGERSKAETHL